MPDARKWCVRCKHEIVPRCGCGARLEFPYRNDPRKFAFQCAKEKDHTQFGRNLTPSCLCHRANVGPDESPPPSFVGGIAAPPS